MKTLNNDQRLKKAHKDVREMGVIASTVLLVEIESLVKRRIVELNAGEDNINLANHQSVINVLSTFLKPFAL